MREDQFLLDGRWHSGLAFGLIVVRLGRHTLVIRMTHVVRTAQWRRFLLMFLFTGACVSGYPPASYHPTRNGSLPLPHSPVDPFRRTDGATPKQSRRTTRGAGTCSLLILAPTGVGQIHSPARARPAPPPSQTAPEPPAPWGIPPRLLAAQPPPEPQAPPVSLTPSEACPNAPGALRPFGPPRTLPIHTPPPTLQGHPSSPPHLMEHAPPPATPPTRSGPAPRALPTRKRQFTPLDYWPGDRHPKVPCPDLPRRDPPSSVAVLSPRLRPMPVVPFSPPPGSNRHHRERPAQSEDVHSNEISRPSPSSPPSGYCPPPSADPMEAQPLGTSVTRVGVPLPGTPPSPVLFVGPAGLPLLPAVSPSGDVRLSLRRYSVGIPIDSPSVLLRLDLSIQPRDLYAIPNDGHLAFTNAPPRHGPPGGIIGIEPPPSASFTGGLPPSAATQRLRASFSPHSPLSGATHWGPPPCPVSHHDSLQPPRSSTARLGGRAFHDGGRLPRPAHDEV